MVLLLMVLRAAVAPEFMPGRAADGRFAIVPCHGLSAAVPVHMPDHMHTDMHAHMHGHAPAMDDADQSGDHHHDRSGEACPFALAVHAAFYDTPLQDGPSAVAGPGRYWLPAPPAPAVRSAPPLPARGPPLSA
jgi:hypothetical protein